jgi:hypothetical protein
LARHHHHLRVRPVLFQSLPWMKALNYKQVMFNWDTHKCIELGGSCVRKCSDYLSVHRYALLQNLLWASLQNGGRFFRA